ncbi:MAG: aminotransferase [Gammaproteobacteria bacterium]|nr:MAG: aminotransferase [Gammaproteobacteria bacterium]
MTVSVALGREIYKEEHLKVSYSRRRFLKNTGFVAGLSAMVGSAWADVSSAKKQAEPFQFQDWSSLRNEFELDYSWRNFAGFLLASPVRSVRESMDYHRHRLNRNPANYLLEGYSYEGEARKWAGKYLGVEASQIALTDSTTMGLATLYNNISIRPGQEVLSTEHEHYSSITSLKYRSEREGFRVNTIRLYDEPQKASADEMLDRLAKQINSKTRVLALTWVHSGSSVKLPAAEVGKLVAELNRERDEADRILFCLDGVHGFGVDNKNFEEFGCDYFIAGTHKWMFGPSGTGIICSREAQMKDISPTIPPFNLTGEKSFGAEMTPGGFHSFEHRWALSKAFEFHLQLGKQRVQERIHSLNTYLKHQLAETPGVQLMTPMSSELSAGFTFFRVESMEPTAVQKLMKNNKIIVSPADRDAGPVVRMAPGILNSTDEIDEVTQILRKLA